MAVPMIKPRLLWFRFVPDDGPATTFSASSAERAQRFAAEHFHGQPGAIFQVEVEQ